MPGIPPEDAAFLRQQGWTDEQIAQTQPIGFNQPNKPSGISAIGTIPAVAKAHAGSYIGGGIGAIGVPALMGALAGSEVPVAGNIIGGIAGALAGAYGGQKLQQAAESPDTYQQQQDVAQQAQAEHPLIGGATDIALSALASGGLFSPKTALKGIRDLIGGNLSTEAKGVLLQSGLNPAINTGLSVAQGQGVPSFSDLAEQSIGGALFAKSWLPGGRFQPAEDEPQTEVNNQTKASQYQLAGSTPRLQLGFAGEPYIDVEANTTTVHNQPAPIQAPIESASIKPEILQEVIDKGATKPIYEPA